MSDRPVGLSRYDLGMIVTSCVWGANFTAIKYALASMPPLVFSAVRFVLASGLMWAVARKLEGPSRLERRTAWRLVGLGVIGNTGYQALFMTGLNHTTATNSSFIVGATPALVAGLGSALGVERPTARVWIGIVLATVGVGTVIAAKGVSLSLDTIGGDLLILMACACWAVFTVGVRWVGRGTSPLRVSALTTAAGTPGLVLLAWPGFGKVAWGTIDAATWATVLYSGVLAIGLAYVLWSFAVQAIGGTRTAIYNCLIPLVASLVAWLVLGERPTAAQVGGAGLVIAGVLVSQTGAAIPAAFRRPVGPVPAVPD
jgi:drug/metabolite transporter (DMT)-like permease